MTRSDRASLMVLMSLATITARALLELAATNPTATACLDAVRRGDAGSPADRRKAAVLEPDAIAAALASVGGRLVALGDAEYPARLMELADPPACLFVRGRALELGVLRPVAIVGSRTCSPAGLEMAAALGAALAAAGSCVISGAALGIDAAAHGGALHAGGPTIAVLGCGIDVVYPKSNRELFERLAHGGTVLSEYPPGTPPEPFRFPARNRIVAGLASAVVVVEGANGSGSMITAELALDIGRDVLAVPGPVTSDLSDVPHQLIRDGATLIRGPEDLLADLGIEEPAVGPLRSTAPGSDGDAGPPGAGGGHATRLGSVPKELRVDAGRTLAAIAGRTAPDDLATRLGLPLPRVSGLLMELELAGLVRSIGGRYERTLDRRRTGR
jgi:DNA processing protein